MKPNLDIQVEPNESGKAGYLPLAPSTEGGTRLLKLVLRLQLKNKETSAVKVTAITFSFPGTSHAAVHMKDINSYKNLDLAAGATTYWCNGKSHTDSSIDNAVFISGDAPPKVKIEVECKNFSDPASLTLDLTPHKSPVAGDAYLFPYATSDLGADEYMTTSANHWANGGVMGTQIFAHDVGCIGWDDNAGAWSELVHGGNKMKNKDWRIYGKPVRAMADGTVADSHTGEPENTITADSDGKLQFPDPPPADGCGNHITIRYGTEVVTYCHLKSIPAALQTNGTAVTAGQIIGYVGNTGNATNPHTHLECERESDNGLRPMPFRMGWVVDKAKLSPPGTTGPWFRLRAHGISKDSVAIWPLGRHPDWRGWQDLGSPVKAAPAVSSWEAHRLDVFSAGVDGQLNHKWWDGSSWHNWQTLGGTFKGGPAAVSWGKKRIDVFVRGMDDHLGHFWYNGSEWKGWEDLGGPIASAPAVASWGEHRLDVFAEGTDAQLKHKWWDGSKWHEWQNLGGTFKGAPAAVSWAANRIDVFVRGMDDHLGHLWWNGNAWQGWQDLGGSLTSAPAVASWEAHRLDVFAARTNGDLERKFYDGSKWSDWDWIGGTFQGNPAAVSWGPNRLDVFIRGMDDHLGHLWRG